MFTTKMILAISATVLSAFAASNAAFAVQKPYQVTKQIACSGGYGCTLTFDALTSPVVLKHVSCQFEAGGDVTTLIIATLNANNKSGVDTEYQTVNFIFGNSLVGEFYFINSNSFLFADAGGTYSVTIGIGNAESLQCTISGDYIDAKASAT